VLTFSPILVEFVQDGEVPAQLCFVVNDWFRMQSRVSELIHCIYIRVLLRVWQENYLVGGFTTLDPSAQRNLAAVNLVRYLSKLIS
jgi:hypothetical protein